MLELQERERDGRSSGFASSARLRLLFSDPGATPENRGDKCTDSAEYFHEYKGTKLSFQITKRKHARIDRDRTVRALLPLWPGWAFKLNYFLARELLTLDYKCESASVSFASFSYNESFPPRNSRAGSHVNLSEIFSPPRACISTTG